MLWWFMPVFMAAVALAAPGVVAADTSSAPAKLSQKVVTVGDSALAKVNVHAKFSSVDSVCFDFTFVNDLLDPGEFLRITPLKLFPSLGGFGIQNVGSTPQAERTVCVDSSGNPDVTALFTDGRENDLEIAMESGSVQIASLVVTVTGTPA